MKRKRNIFLYAILTLLLVSIVLSVTVSAQLVLVNMKVKIVEVEKNSNRLQVRVHEGGNKDVQYVEIDNNTRFSHNMQSISHSGAWRSFHEDMMIRVKGGYTMGGHVKAKQIYW
ncbi:MAG: hypothetical protein RDV48_20060 [Candidatus Eremiobacteraeota bacterium]|nr:hypothetical protein [Candidatus Eremiobacteraeota bacterium]